MEQRKLLERELDILRDRLLLMGGEVELALQRAMHALSQRDSEVANQVIENDRVIDRMELEIDRLSVEVLTLRRPVARELRTGDFDFQNHADSRTHRRPRFEHRARRLRTERRAGAEKLTASWTKWRNAPLEMLQSALDAFTSNDSEKARQSDSERRGS